MKRKDDIECLNCGKKFHAARKETKFCCRECGIEYNKRNGKYKKSEEQKKVLSDLHKGKEPWNKGKKTSAESIAKFRESIKNVWTEEKRKEQSDRQKEVWNNEELRKRHSEQAIIRYKNKPEIKDKIANRMHEYNETVSIEKWHDRYIKGYNTKIDNGTIFTGSSLIEKEIKNYIEGFGFKTVRYVMDSNKKKLEIDIYIPELKFGIEYNGTYYHSSNGTNKKPSTYHFNKNILANEEGIEIMHIWEDQWKNKKDIIKNIIKTRIGKNDTKIEFIENCVIKKIDIETYKRFCENNDIDGYKSASIILGLYYKDKLIQIAGFNKIHEDEYEWIKGYPESNCTIKEYTKLLFNYFINIYDPISVIYYSDWNVFSSKEYLEFGFKWLGYTGPNKFYITNSSRMLRINRNPYANQEHKRLVAENKLYECHGCGSKKFVWYREEV